MMRCRPIDTRLNSNIKLLPRQGEPLSNPERYRQLVDKLNYLTVTRPDISFPVSVVSQFMTSPCDSHWGSNCSYSLIYKVSPRQRTTL